MNVLVIAGNYSVGDVNNQPPHLPGANARPMSDDESLAAAIFEDVALVPHDPAWVDAFQAERLRLHGLLPGTFVAIEHIGSTALLGIVSKPVVDIMAGVESLAGAATVVDVLCGNGYTTSKDFNDSLADRKWLMRWRDGHRTHHLHIVVHRGVHWNDWLAFRDALRRDPDVAARYAAVKTHCARAHRDDREAYTAAKAAFVSAVVSAEANRRGSRQSGP